MVSVDLKHHVYLIYMYLCSKSTIDRCSDYWFLIPSHPQRLYQGEINRGKMNKIKERKEHH